MDLALLEKWLRTVPGFADATITVGFGLDRAVSSDRRNTSAMMGALSRGGWMGKRADYSHRLTEADRLEIQRRVTAGETFASAAAAVGCSTKSIQRFMAWTGAMRPKLRKRSPRHLSLEDREEVLRGSSLAKHSVASHCG